MCSYLKSMEKTKTKVRRVHSTFQASQNMLWPSRRKIIPPHTVESVEIPSFTATFGGAEENVRLLEGTCNKRSACALWTSA